MRGRLRWVVSGGVTVFAVLFFSDFAVACRCKEPSVKMAYSLADGAILGSVESQQEDGDTMVTTFIVDRAWKRSIPARIRLVSAKPCGFAFQVAQRYLVFLTETTTDSFGTRRCRGNVLASRAAPALKWLRAHAIAAAID